MTEPGPTQPAAGTTGQDANAVYALGSSLGESARLSGRSCSHLGPRLPWRPSR